MNGIFILLCCAGGIFAFLGIFVEILGYVIDRIDLIRKNYTVYKVDGLADGDGRPEENSSYRTYECTAPDGTSIEYKTNDKLDDGSSIFIKPDVGGGYVRVGTASKPGFVSALFLGIAVICFSLGIGGHIYLRDPSQIDMFVRVFAMVCCSIPATVIGISGIISNHRVCCRANLVEARVSGYEWDTRLNLSDSHNDEAVRTQIGMWVEFEHNSENVKALADYVGVAMEKRYPVGHTVPVYVSPDMDCSGIPGAKGAVILKRKRYRGMLQGIFLTAAGIATAVILVYTRIHPL